MIDALNGMGSTYRDLGQMSKAMQCVERALTLSRSAGFRKGEADALRISCMILMDRAQYETALEHLEQALTIIKTALHDGHNRGAVLNNIGMAHNQIGQPRKALAILEKALEIYREAVNRRLEALDLCEMGVAYRQLRQFEEAMQFHE